RLLNLAMEPTHLGRLFKIARSSVTNTHPRTLSFRIHLRSRLLRTAWREVAPPPRQEQTLWDGTSNSMNPPQPSERSSPAAGNGWSRSSGRSCSEFADSTRSSPQVGLELIFFSHRSGPIPSLTAVPRPVPPSKHQTCWLLE